MAPAKHAIRSVLRTVCLLVCLIPGPLHAAASEDNEADHDALRAFKTLFEEAVNTNQLDLLEPHLHDPFSVVTYTDREFDDFEAFKTRWQTTRDEMLQGGTYSVELLPDRSVIDGDIAVAKGDSKNILMTGGGSEFHFTSKWTVVFRKVDDEWKILRVHSSLNPFSNAIVESHVRGLVIKSVIAALLAGLVLGWFVRMLVVRKKVAQATPSST